MQDNEAADRAGMPTRTVVTYIVCGYVAVVVLFSLVFVGTSGLFALLLIAVLAGVWVARRTRESTTDESPAALELDLPEPLAALPTTPTGAALLRRRLDVLAQDLPEAAIDSPLLVGLADLYEHEPVEERERLEAEYGRQRERLVHSIAELDRGVAPGRLLPEVERLEAYANGLRALAQRAGDDPVAAALEATGSAADALAAAHVAANGVDGPVPAELAKELDGATAKLRAAEAAFPAGAERPLLALRLADEVERSAAGVRKRAQRLGDLPAQLERRMQEFDRAAPRVERELGRVKEEFRTA